jgi:hypothetical protein
MTRLPVLLLLAALPASLAWSPPAAAQTSRPAAALSAAQAERKSVELKQGMSLEDVEGLLGKPRRTALKNGGSAGGSLAVDLFLDRRRLLARRPERLICRQDPGAVVLERLGVVDLLSAARELRA